MANFFLVSLSNKKCHTLYAYTRVLVCMAAWLVFHNRVWKSSTTI